MENDATAYTLNKPKNTTINDLPTKKKISFFSAMFIVMGSCIGAGIFFKAEGVLKASHGSLVLAIVSWVIAAFVVICMAIALIEIASAKTNNNLSVIGWCKLFNSRTIYKAAKNFMFYIYLPLTYFFIPLYIIMSLQDGLASLVPGGVNHFGTNGYDWIIWTIIAFALNGYFIFVSGLSAKTGNIMNWVIMGVKFFPLIVAAFIGFFYIGFEGTENISVGFDPSYELKPTTSFSAISPGIGLFIAIGAIFFAFDGFYFSAGIQSEMKEPKKTPLAILFGLGLTTIIYLMIAISMALNGTGSFGGFGKWLKLNNLGWLFGMLNICIGIGIVGILNSFAMWAPRFTEDLIADNELPFSEKFQHKLNHHKPIVGIMYSLAITIPFIIVATIVGALWYSDTAGYGVNTYGEPHMAKLFSFTDLVATWTAVFAFAFVMASIYGGLRNRQKQTIAIQKQKYFIVMGLITVISISVVLIFLIAEPIIDLFLLIQLVKPNVTFNDSSPIKGYNFTSEDILARTMKFLMLIVYLIIMFVPTIVEDKMNIKKYGSLQNYQEHLDKQKTISL